MVTGLGSPYYQAKTDLPVGIKRFFIYMSARALVVAGKREKGMVFSGGFQREREWAWGLSNMVGITQLTTLFYPT